MERAISIHSPHTRGDPDHQTTGATRAISIHSPHTRGDRINLAGIQPHHRHFNPLPSYEGRPVKPSSTPQQPKVFQSTPLIRGETCARREGAYPDAISIHSPHTRGDRWRGRAVSGARGISIHSPHTRGDDRPQGYKILDRHFNPLPSYEGRPGVARSTWQAWISIHSPHTRGDSHLRHQSDSFRFQSTPLIRGETGGGTAVFCPPNYFNPLPSYEGRRLWVISHANPTLISIHSPHTRGDTQALQPEPSTGRISIHSPHTRGDATAQAGRH